MEAAVRLACAEDVAACGRIIHLAFSEIAEQHGFPSSFPTVEHGVALAAARIGNPRFFGAVAELDGKVAGSIFMSERDPIQGIGTVSVDPGLQGEGVGRLLMGTVLVRGKGAAGLRLTQDAFNCASMSLYASLGFEIKEPLAMIDGLPRSGPAPGLEIRALSLDDLAACAALCERVHGFPRTEELRDAIGVQTPHVAIRHGRITAYATGVAKGCHGVAESEEDLQGLLLGIHAATQERITILLPTRQAALFRWCLAEGLRVIKPETLMARGAYQEPRGAFFPSTQY